MVIIKLSEIFQIMDTIEYKEEDIVLVKSRAGAAIPPIHVRLLEREIRAPSKSNTFDWPGYSGWMATPIYQKEIEILKKEWSIMMYSWPTRMIIFQDI